MSRTNWLGRFAARLFSLGNRGGGGRVVNCEGVLRAYPLSRP